jgi:hypothetical protein
MKVLVRWWIACLTWHPAMSLCPHPLHGTGYTHDSEDMVPCHVVPSDNDSWGHHPAIRTVSVATSANEMNCHGRPCLHVGRRNLLIRSHAWVMALGLVGGLMPTMLWAAESLGFTADSASLPTGLLETRVTENIVAPPPYGMEGSDALYPR